MSLITLQTYKTITGTTATTNDVLLETYLIPAVSDAVEGYVGRLLLEDDYIKWVRTGQFGLVTDLQAPVNRVNALWCEGYVISVKNNGDTAISITVTEDDIAITEMGTGLTYVYPFGQYGSNKYSDLISAIGGDLPVDMTIEAGVYDGPCNLLKSETVAISKNGTGNLSGPIDALYGWKPVYNGVQTNVANTNLCISYNGGYKVLPYDLQVAVANMCRDMLQIQLSDGTPKFKSESQGSYSYSLADGIVPSEVLTPYTKTLDGYRMVHY